MVTSSLRKESVSQSVARECDVKLSLFKKPLAFQELVEFCAEGYCRC